MTTRAQEISGPAPLADTPAGRLRGKVAGLLANTSLPTAEARSLLDRIVGEAGHAWGYTQQDCEHHSWAGLMQLLDEHWPADIFPTVEHDDLTRDAGARIVSLIRWVTRLQQQQTELRPGQRIAFEVGGASWEMTVGQSVETFRALAKSETDGFLRVHDVAAVPAAPRLADEVAAGLRSERCGHTNPADPWMDCQLVPGHMGDPPVPGRLHRRGDTTWAEQRPCGVQHPIASQLVCEQPWGHGGTHQGQRTSWAGGEQ